MRLKKAAREVTFKVSEEDSYIQAFGFEKVAPDFEVEWGGGKWFMVKYQGNLWSIKKLTKPICFKQAKLFSYNLIYQALTKFFS